MSLLARPGGPEGGSNADLLCEPADPHRPGATLLGARVPRLEDDALLTGRGRFVDDIHLPGLLQAAFVRSPHAHAVIRSIDASAARAAPGVHAVFSYDDLRPHLVTDRLVVGLPSSHYKQDHHRPVLAADETVHVGEPIVIVLADDRYLAEDAATLVDIDFDPLPAVSDCRAALATDAPLVHRESPHNLLAEFDMTYGDVERAFTDAAHVFHESFWQHRGGSHSIECRGCVAQHDALEDRTTLWTSTQMPHAAMRVICEMLGLHENQIRVATPDVGGGFGPKLVTYPEEVCVTLAARLVGRPVKWIEDRREHFIATTQERDQYWDTAIAVDAQGRVLGLRGEIVHDHGAYTARGINLPHNSAENVPLGYEVPHYAMQVKVALTNKVPVTPVRGAGHPQGTFVMERLLDRVARELKLDRAEVRRRNLVPATSMPYRTQLKARGGQWVTLDSGDFPKCMSEALERADWVGFPARQARARTDGRHLGIGLSNFVKGTGRGPFESVTVRIGSSGKVHVYAGAAAMGQGTRTMLAQIVAEQLGRDLSNITVTTGDTAATAMGLGGSNSRQTVVAGSSAHVAATKVRAKLLQVAATLLKATEHELDIEATEVVVVGQPARRVAFGVVARSLAGIAGYSLPGGVSAGLEATEQVVLDDMAFANGTAVVELEVDVETGGVRIHRIVFVHDSGRLINPLIVEGQLAGGIAHGVGNALFEWMGFDENAQPVTTNLGEYLLVTSTEMPRMELYHQESPTPINPIGVKGVGECGVIPMTPAIMSALEDALAPFAVRINQTPITPAQLYALIAEGRAK
ncbi:MAG: xanthine dehydrogenase family protein molybdopterin-binding subunit [Proteobacteria bacterium]|nr:xanthine dehydrogenase family protein molybdopterin-binding subunit [Burkholderiales bacterium]